MKIKLTGEHKAQIECIVITSYFAVMETLSWPLFIVRGISDKHDVSRVARDRVKRRFLIQNISAGNMTPLVCFRESQSSSAFY